MGFLQCLGDLASQTKCFGQRHPAVPQPAIERFSSDVFHNQEHGIPFFANFEDFANVGMIKCGGRHRLTAETFLCLPVSCQGERKQLYGYLTIEPWIARVEHNAHATLANWGKDLVGTKASAGS
jgi:hypothetical protein